MVEDRLECHGQSSQRLVNGTHVALLPDSTATVVPSNEQRHEPLSKANNSGSSQAFMIFVDEAWILPLTRLGIGRLGRDTSRIPSETAV